MFEKYYICKQTQGSGSETYLIAVNKMGGCLTIDNERSAVRYKTRADAQKAIDVISNRVYPWKVVERSKFIKTQEARA